MSSKRMPAVGKSGKRRICCCSPILRRASSEAVEGGEAGSRSWGDDVEASG